MKLGNIHKGLIQGTYTSHQRSRQTMSDSRESFTIGALDSLPLQGSIMPMSKRFNPRAENLKKMNNTQGGFFSPRITTAD